MTKEGDTKMTDERREWENEGDGCNDCGAPARWNESRGWYEHIDPNAPECFLMGSAGMDRGAPTP